MERRCFFSKKIVLYRVRLSIDGKEKSFGVYATIENAVEAYNKAIKEHHGEYAKVIDFDTISSLSKKEGVMKKIVAELSSFIIVV